MQIQRRTFLAGILAAALLPPNMRVAPELAEAEAAKVLSRLIPPEPEAAPILTLVSPSGAALEVEQAVTVPVYVEFDESAFYPGLKEYMQARAPVDLKLTATVPIDGLRFLYDWIAASTNPVALLGARLGHRAHRYWGSCTYGFKDQAPLVNIENLILTSFIQDQPNGGLTAEFTVRQFVLGDDLRKQLVCK